ncbi:MAG TPA: HesA/MoeB/ThiF family protein [Smithellaceae bacterium]|nr:HesA/MoeB/ThiF family protein [Smithellaceae bacterium]
MNRRYSRNVNAISPGENDSLSHFRVLVAGCGGIGGFVIEELGRLGIGHITAVDGDVFDETNLNRQILSTPLVMGKSKSAEAKMRMSAVNPDVAVKPLHMMITEGNCRDLVCGHDLVIDALDNVACRLVLEAACREENIPMIHGAIAGWCGQVSVVFPGDDTLKKLYPERAGRDVHLNPGSPPFTPAVIASIEVAETVKVLLGRGNPLRNKLLTIDLLLHDYEVISL